MNEEEEEEEKASEGRKKRENFVESFCTIVETCILRMSFVE